MVAEKGNGLKSRVAYLAAGVVTLAFVIVLGWFDLAIPLNIRQPVASPDGDYFAYFDRAEGRAGAEKASDLIISTPAGQIVARVARGDQLALKAGPEQSRQIEAGNQRWGSFSEVSTGWNSGLQSCIC